jgi:hypothetical protein
MTADTRSSKRRRGGQPGNRNARGNRGNARPRPNWGNRGNRTPRAGRVGPLDVLLKDYARSPEATEWLRAHAAELQACDFVDDGRRDRALYDAFRGLTPEALASSGREYRCGVYAPPQDEDGDEEAA